MIRKPHSAPRVCPSRRLHGGLQQVHAPRPVHPGPAAGQGHRRRHRDRRRRTDLPRQAEGLLHQAQHRPDPQAPPRAARPSCRPSSAGSTSSASATWSRCCWRKSQGAADQGRRQRQQLDRLDPAADFGGLVVKDPTIKSPKDLVGKKVATNTLKNIVDTTVKTIVNKDGGDPSKVNFVELAFPDMAAALDAGQRRRASSWSSRSCPRPRPRAGQQIGSYADVDPNLCVALYFTSHRADRPATRTW